MQTFAYTSKSILKNRASNDAWVLTFEAIGKNNELSPYLIANEWIAGNIGWLLGLPVPPVLIGMTSKKRNRMFGSIRFNLDIGPPDLQPEACYKSLPDLCVGVLLFDILIANNDRHAMNLKVDHPTKPKAIYLFDHDHCLFNVTSGEGIKRLDSLKASLGVSAGKASAGNRHCFLDVVDDPKRFDCWMKLIAEIPDWFLARICDDTTRLGLKAHEAAAVLAFLRHRRKNIEQLIFAHRDSFKGIGTWGLFDLPTPDTSSQNTSPP